MFDFAEVGGGDRDGIGIRVVARGVGHGEPMPVRGRMDGLVFGRFL
jgi:hypothetical protein